MIIVFVFLRPLPPDFVPRHRVLEQPVGGVHAGGEGQAREEAVRIAIEPEPAVSAGRARDAVWVLAEYGLDAIGRDPDLVEGPAVVRVEPELDLGGWRARR